LPFAKIAGAIILAQLASSVAAMQALKLAGVARVTSVIE